MTTDSHSKIGVLMGGYSAEREISLKSGRAVTAALSSLGRNACPIDIVERDAEKIKSQILTADISAAFIALHGQLGEDGLIQRYLRDLNIPYTGSSPEAHEIAFNKIRTQKLLKSEGLPVPKFFSYRLDDGPFSPDLVWNFFHGHPVAVKPATEGSSIGVSLVSSPRDLNAAVDRALAYGPQIIIEEWIKGRELTVGLVDGRPLCVIEIIPGNPFFDFEAKYQKGKTRYDVPANLDPLMAKILQGIARRAWDVLGCRGFARIDFMLLKSQPYLLEVNTIPGFTETSLLPMAAAHEGISFNELCQRILNSIYGETKTKTKTKNETGIRP